MDINNFFKKYFLIVVIFIILSAPALVILGQGFLISPNQLEHDYLINLLPQLISNTFKLLFWVILFSTVWSLVISLSCSLTNLKYKILVKRLIFIPLTLPLYVSSFIYLSISDYGSPVSLFLREKFNVNLDQITQSAGPIWIGFVFSLYLSPYMTMALNKIYR